MIAYQIAVAAVVLGQIADAISTQHFRGQGVREANPALRALMERCGNCWLVAKAIFAAAIAGILLAVGPSLGSFVACALLVASSAYAAWHNFSK